MSNPEVITLTCPTCGAKLKLGNSTNLVYCTSCGNEHLVQRGDGSIYLAPMAADVAHMRVGVDKTAAELAIIRLVAEIPALEQQEKLLGERLAKEYNLYSSADTTNGFGALLVATLTGGILTAAMANNHIEPYILLTVLGISFVVVLVAAKRLLSPPAAQAARRQKLDETETALATCTTLLVRKRKQFAQQQGIANS